MPLTNSTALTRGIDRDCPDFRVNENECPPFAVELMSRSQNPEADIENRKSLAAPFARAPVSRCSTVSADSVMLRAGQFRKAAMFNEALAILGPAMEKSPNWHAATALGPIVRRRRGGLRRGRDVADRSRLRNSGWRHGRPLCDPAGQGMAFLSVDDTSSATP